MENLPFTIENKILSLTRRADRVIVYSMTGSVILHEMNVTNLALDFREPMVILTIRMADQMYQYKYVSTP